MYGLYFVTAAFDRTYFNRAYELHVLLYARGYGVFAMLNVDKMKYWDIAGVQKNETVFKINWKHHYNA